MDGGVDVKKQLPRWRVVSYVEYVAYLDTYNWHISSLHGDSSKAENRGKEER